MSDSITPEVQALIDAAIADATGKLSENNKKLMKELSNARAKLKSDVDPEEYVALQSKLEELQGQLEKSSKTYESESRKTSKALEAERAFTRKLLVDNGLTESAAKVGVKAEYLPAVRALLQNQVQVVEDGETRTAKIGDKGIGDFMAAWAQTDEGKHFVSAPANSGGGAQGGANGGGAQNKPRSKMNYQEKAEFIKANGHDKYMQLPN